MSDKFTIIILFGLCLIIAFLIGVRVGKEKLPLRSEGCIQGQIVNDGSCVWMNITPDCTTGEQDPFKKREAERTPER